MATFKLKHQRRAVPRHHSHPIHSPLQLHHLIQISSPNAEMANTWTPAFRMGLLKPVDKITLALLLNQSIQCVSLTAGDHLWWAEKTWEVRMGNICLLHCDKTIVTNDVFMCWYNLKVTPTAAVPINTPFFLFSSWARYLMRYWNVSDSPNWILSTYNVW